VPLKRPEEILLAEKKAKGVLKEINEQSSEIVTLAQKRANEIVENQRHAKKEVNA